MVTLQPAPSPKNTQMALSAVGTRLSPSSPGSQPRRSPRGSALLSASSPSLKYPLKPLNANGGGEAIAQAKLVHNLQQQVPALPVPRTVNADPLPITHLATHNRSTSSSSSSSF